jgi:DNA polymerase-3 subunit epsilon
MNFIAFDLETTGTLAGIDRIVEIGAVRFVDGKPSDIYSTLVDPLMPIPEGASRVNGITDDMVEGKPKVEECLESFTKFCGPDPLVAHNASFDFQFFLNAYRKHEFLAPSGYVFDTLALSKRIIPGLSNYRLATIAQHMKFKFGTLHRAHEDAEVCGKVFVELMNRALPNEYLDRKSLEGLQGKAPLKFPYIERESDQLTLI